MLVGEFLPFPWASNQTGRWPWIIRLRAVWSAGTLNRFVFDNANIMIGYNLNDGMGGMGRLTTHILDTASGLPAVEVRIDLYAVHSDGEEKIASAVTNGDGRCDAPVLENDAFVPGIYELRFHIGDYFRGRGEGLPSPAFFDIVPIRFGIASVGDHYHVPLLISPYGYSTYRGS
tara:strand:- start:2780 stop:3301 length:522 start_codon:yes stop_codon:yes gene_type:complete